MKGVILGFTEEDNLGYISGDDGKRYKFKLEEWKEHILPKKGDIADFDIDSNGDPVQIFLLNMDTSNYKNNYKELLKIEANYNMFDWFIKCFRHYVDFSGRAQKKEYWYFQLCQCLIVTIPNLYILLVLRENTESIFTNVFSLLTFCIFFIPNLSVTVRRLHDTGKSGLWAILVLINYVYFILLQYDSSSSVLVSLFQLGTIIALIVLCCVDTEPKENVWGLPAYKNNTNNLQGENDAR